MHWLRSGEWGNVLGLGFLLAALLYFVFDLRTAGVVVLICSLVGSALVFVFSDRRRRAPERSRRVRLPPGV